MYSLRLLGGLSLESPEGPIAGRAAQRRQLALLAILGTTGDKGCSRDKLIGYLWPDSPGAQARHILADAVYLLRRALGEDSVLASADFLRLNPEIVWTDVRGFEQALATEDLSAAVDAYEGPFLDGFYLTGAREFEHWVDIQRQRLARSIEKTIETLAEQSEEARDYPGAVDWWGRLAALDPYNSRVAIRLMEGLAAIGDPANAIQQAEEHAMLLKSEMGMEPPADFLEVVERLRTGGSGVSRESDSGTEPSVRLPGQPELSASTTGKFVSTKPYRVVAPSMVAVLHRYFEGSEEHHPVIERFMVGRELGDLVLHGDPFLSSRHLEVVGRDSEFVLRDLESMNGTFVRIEGVTPLEPGDSIMVGSQVFRLQAKPAEPGVQLARIDGGVEVEAYDLPPGSTRIGRTRGDVCFPDDRLMADEHAEVTAQPSGKGTSGSSPDQPPVVTVEALSDSGTVFLRIHEEHLLKDGDVFAAGRQVFRFERAPPAPPKT